MVMAVDSGRFDVVARIEYADLRCEGIDHQRRGRTHNFIAGGVVTHNSNLSLARRASRELNQIPPRFPQGPVPVLYTLEQKYRSTGTILEDDPTRGLRTTPDGWAKPCGQRRGRRATSDCMQPSTSARSGFVVNRIREWVGVLRAEVRGARVALLYRSKRTIAGF